MAGDPSIFMPVSKLDAERLRAQIAQAHYFRRCFQCSLRSHDEHSQSP
jgi:hypothetical protein